ncbi:MAG: MarR family transcriptional regulator [Rhizobiaceae bacterium]|nr:MarR family transcriptional regulator [Rhizobiaceae bacterium]
MLLMKNDPASLGFLLHDATRLLRRRFEQRAGIHGLSAAQWRLLVAVVKDEGVAQARLAEVLEVEPISVSRLVDRMEAAGWIERRSDSTDRRVRTIHPTDKCRALFQTIRAYAAEVYDEAFRGMAGPERQAVMAGLAAIISNLSTAVGGEQTSERLAS